MMRRELEAGLKRLSGKGECLENIFAQLYMIAGFPAWCAEDDFCAWVKGKNPSNEEIVEYFYTPEIKE